jgi:hypothetical protein
MLNKPKHCSVVQKFASFSLRVTKIITLLRADVSVNGLSHDTSSIRLLNFKMSIANGACFKSYEMQELSPLL